MSIKKFIYILPFLVFSNVAFSQDVPPEDQPDAEVPIDSSFAYLLTSGVMLGAGVVKYNLRKKS